MLFVIDPSSNNVPSAAESDTDISVGWMMPSISGIDVEPAGGAIDVEPEDGALDVELVDAGPHEVDISWGGGSIW